MTPTTELISYIRFWLANLPEDIISDEDMTQIIEMVKLQNPTASDCQLLYLSTVAVLKWIIRKESQGSAGEVGTGEVSKRVEKRGQSSIEVNYSVGTSGGTAGSWDSILEGLEEDPDSIGCPVYPENPTGTGLVLLGISGDKYKPNTPWRKTADPRKPLSWREARDNRR